VERVVPNALDGKVGDELAPTKSVGKRVEDNAFHLEQIA
jgi:hypothetical protein